MRKLALILILMLAWMLPAYASADSAKASFIRAVRVKLAENPPYERGREDCSSAAWELRIKLIDREKLEIEFGGTHVLRWFRRSRARDQAQMPFPRIAKEEALLGDLLFGIKAGTVNHVVLKWIGHSIVHHTLSGGFRADWFLPGQYWWPRIAWGRRPPW